MRLIDLEHLGREHVIGAWLVGDVLVDPGPGSTLDTLLAGLDGEVPRIIALTHIHLDHAGATGALCERWPDAEVCVHERGARHLIDPAKLMASAGRLYGDDMDRLWGEMRPVPEDRIRILGEGRTEDFRHAATPGHASHHLSYLHEPTGTLFAGDTAGVRVLGAPTLGATPPPDIDLEAWMESIALFRAWDPDRVAPTHFGVFEDVGEHLDALEAWFDTWGRQARELDEAQWVAEHHTWFAARAEPEVVGALEQAAPPEQCYAGLARYWSKRAG
jgi:glyoxylase-like metal-dependent hydrolase (beta-lactamase superfamily II)